MESFFPVILSPALVVSTGGTAWRQGDQAELDENPYRKSHSPLNVALGLGGLDLGLALSVLLLTGGGEGGWLGRAADGLVSGLDTGTDKLLSLTDDGVGLGSARLG